MLFLLLQTRDVLPCNVTAHGAGLHLCYRKMNQASCLDAVERERQSARPGSLRVFLALLHGIAAPRSHQLFFAAMREVGDLLTSIPSGGIWWKKYPPPRALVSPPSGSPAGLRDTRQLRSPHRG